MNFLKAKYQGYVKDPKTVARLRSERRAGEFRLALEDKIRKRPSLGTWFVYFVFNFGFWWLLTFRRPRRISGFLLLVNDRHVRAALSDKTGRFQVIARADQVAMFGEPPNLMGSEGEEHARQREVFTHILYGDGRDIEAEMQAVAESKVKYLLEDARGQIDVLDDLLIPVLVETAHVVHGVPREDPHAFMAWTMRAAEQFISPFPAKENDMRRSFESARRLSSSHRRLIRAGRSEVRDGSTLDRMLEMRDNNVTICAGTAHEIGGREYLTEDRLTNMLVGFAFTLATQYLPDAHALNRVLKKKRLRGLAEQFSNNGDRDGMRAMVRECFRCHPATWPWVARKVNLKDGASTDFVDGIKLRHGDTMLISIPAALRDPAVWANPWSFDETRTAGSNSSGPDIDLAFGVGPHRCMGRGPAEAVATAILMSLFSKSGMRATGPMVSRENTIIPASLPARFDADAPQGQQVVVTAVIPVNPCPSKVQKAGRERTEQKLRALTKLLRRSPNYFERRRIERRAMRNAEVALLADMRREVIRALSDLDAVENDPVAEGIRAAGGIHGFVITVVNLTLKGLARPHIVIELNADGPEEIARERAQEAVGYLLTPALEAAGWGRYNLRNLMERFRKRTQPRLFGDSGLGVFGLPESSVAEIAIERELADFAAEHLNAYCGRATDGNVAFEALEAVREAAKKNEKYKSLLHRPRSRAPKFASHDELSVREAFLKWLRNAPGPRRVLVFTILLVTVPAAFLTSCLYLGNWFTVFLVWVGLSLSLTAVLGLLLGTLGLLFWRKLRAAERSDPEDERQPFLDDYVEAMAREDKTGQRQNHMALVVEKKPGIVRRITLYLSLVVIGWMNRHWFRPGWAHDIGSIRHARVVNIAGARETVFLSNFDGSWSSYVGEFSDRATLGMSMFWSNFTGFVRTNRLVLDGARDDERFKRWVRTQQVPASIVRQRFPDMSNDRIRRNALIREGLSRELTRTEAQRWMRLFGSDPRSVPDMIEPDETQTILFKSFARFPASACVAIQIADGKVEDFRAVLAELSKRPESDQPTDVPIISFGEYEVVQNRPVAVFGLSATGLEKLGVPADTKSRNHAQLHNFPMPFVEGMGRRTRTLGDPVPEESISVGWIDRSDGHPDVLEIDAVFLVAAPRSDRNLDSARDCAVQALIEALGETVADNERVDQNDARYRNKAVKIINSHLLTNADEGQLDHKDRRLLRQGLGFADGISQPLLRGAPGVPEQSPFQIAAGEFILGLPDEKGLRSPSPEVPAGWDLKSDLPDISPLAYDTWPDFSAGKPYGRDLGRNGTFMVVRQLQVNADEFKHDLDQTRHGSTGLGDDYATRAIGRRRDGSPIGSPSFAALHKNGNDEQTGSGGGGFKEMSEPSKLHFRSRDPFGYDVPLGSHVRRAHPRDSMEEENFSEETRHRHRMIRRGRPYVNDSGEREGLLFVCLNASIERQFEFVQQTWLNEPSFHGLFDETDPLLGRGERKFTLPSPDGPRIIRLNRDYVEFRGGGYFFVPSKSALRALSRRRT